jgi:wobble nucleotide-excising tRNase
VEVEDVENQIATQELKLAALRESTAISARPALTELVIPEFPGQFVGSLAKSIEDISADAELRIDANLEAHGMPVAAGRPWILQGLNHVTDSCPFCAQQIKGLPLIAAYRAVFSDRYRNLRQEIVDLRTAIERDFGQTALDRIQAQSERHLHTLEFWNRYCALADATLQYPAHIPDAIQTLKSSSLALLDQKDREPLAAIQVDETFASALRAYETVRSRIDDFNLSVRQANALIAAKKAEVEVGDLTAVTSELTRLKAIQKRYQPDVALLCDEHVRLTGLKNSAEALKDSIRLQLDQYTSGVVRPYENRINELLEDFNTGFKDSRDET